MARSAVRPYRPATGTVTGSLAMHGAMAEQWVRLGMAIVVIALISAGLYQFGGGRAAAVEPNIHQIGLRS